MNQHNIGFNTAWDSSVQHGMVQHSMARRRERDGNSWECTDGSARRTLLPAKLLFRAHFLSPFAAHSAPFMFHMCHSMLQTLGCFNKIYTLRLFLLAYIEYKFAAVIIRTKIGQVFVRVAYYQRVRDDVCNKMTEGG